MSTLEKINKTTYLVKKKRFIIAKIESNQKTKTNTVQYLINLVLLSVDIIRTKKNVKKY